MKGETCENCLFWYQHWHLWIDRAKTKEATDEDRATVERIKATPGCCLWKKAKKAE